MFRIPNAFKRPFHSIVSKPAADVLSRLFKTPTKTQLIAIPRLAIFTAQTGSGKTIAYLAPIINHFHNKIDNQLLPNDALVQSNDNLVHSNDTIVQSTDNIVQSDDYSKLAKLSPFCLIILPTLPLAIQVKNVLENLGFSSILFNQDYRDFLLKNLVADNPQFIVTVADEFWSIMDSKKPIELLKSLLKKTKYIILDEADLILMSPIAKKMVRLTLKMPQIRHFFVSASLKDIQLNQKKSLLPKNWLLKNCNANYLEDVNVEGAHEVPGEQSFVKIYDPAEYLKVYGQEVKPPIETHLEKENDVKLKSTHLISLIETHKPKSTTQSEKILVFCNATWRVELLKSILLQSKLFKQQAPNDNKTLLLKLDSITAKDNRESKINLITEYTTKDSSSNIIKVLICTDVVSRGVDFINVNKVVNFDFPPNAQVYIHRSGRTARAGKIGEVVNFVGVRDERLASRVEELEGSVESLLGRRRALSRQVKRKIEKKQKRFGGFVSEADLKRGGSEVKKRIYK